MNIVYLIFLDLLFQGSIDGECREQPVYVEPLKPSGDIQLSVQEDKYVILYTTKKVLEAANVKEEGY